MDGWVCDRPEAYLMSVDEVGFVVGLATTISTVEMIYGRHHAITSQEWQQERDKMQKKAGQPAQPEQPAQDNSWHERGEFPPAGATVEKKYKSATIWTEIKIVATGNQLVIFGYPAGDESVGEWSDYEFRPLRTEREKAIDEMAGVIANIVGYSITMAVAKQGASALYDAGFRKEQSK